LPTYLKAAWFNSSVWFITYDEGSSNTGYSSFYGGHLFFAAVSPFTTGGHNFTNQTTHYNLLSTVEWLLGLGGTGNNDSTTQFPPMKALFHASNSTPQVHYSVHGRVTALSTGIGITGASVTATGGFSTTTNGSGYFALSVPNGTYSITVTVLGFVTLTSSAKVNGAAVTQNFALTSQSRSSSTFRISGTVASWYNSSLLSGATVRVSAGSSLLTGSNGTYWFYEPNGSYTLTAWHSGSKVTSVLVKVSGAAVTSNFLLPRFYWEISGNVTNATTGARIAGANVSVTSGPSSYNQYARTNTTGVYVLWLANGTYGIRATLGTSAATVKVTVIGTAIVPTIALSASSPVSSTYRISGTVASWYNSSLLSGATVRVSAGSSLLTGSNGTFWFYEPNGSYTLTAWHSGSKVTSVLVKVSGAAVTSNFLLPRFYWEVTGIVTNATTGARIAGANVSVASGPSSYNQYALTNATGVYVLWLANGTYGLRVTHPGSPTRNVTINVTGSSAGSNIALAPVPSAPTYPGPTGAAPSATLPRRPPGR
ncbi:MAG TPA: carboxypeptidase regulatory-like domain-containing protein, partial [Thermoplasmata archaeon]|nr:carboxypeptidase regulatory-like domain-containing protein [Thermoplasmata archaeon]